MKTFNIHTLGCKVNQYESQQIRQLLEKLSLRCVSYDAGADLIVINTCCVTRTASSKSRQFIRKSRKSNPNAEIVVAGCLPAGQTGELNNVTNIRVISDKKQIRQILNDIALKNDSKTLSDCDCKYNKPNNCPNENIYKDNYDLEPLSSFTERCRAFVKVQDGCDGYCTYCVIKNIRNKLWYKPLSIVLDEVYNLIYAGCKEIVLTGIFLGAYGLDTVRRKKWSEGENPNLARLIEKVAQAEGLPRLRLSSLEPADVTDTLLEVMSRHSNIMPHLHLPLQSGSDGVLSRMGRQYRVADFRNVGKKARKYLDRPAITTDIIVGFPGETQEDFERTCQLAEELKFSKIHVFPFSARDNTPAAGMKPQVSAGIIRERSSKLTEIDKKLQVLFRKGFIGREVCFVAEQANPASGRTERYFTASADRPAQKGSLVTTTLK